MSEPLEPRGAARGHLSVDEVSECAFGLEALPAGLVEHVADCPVCAREIEDVRGTLALLAELPEPELPRSVVIRLDAAIEREWQQRDADEERASAAKSAQSTGSATSSASAASTAAGGNRARSAWRRLRVSFAALAVVCGAAVGLGFAVTGNDNGTASTSSGAAGAYTADAGRGNGAPAAPAEADAQLAAMVRRIPAVGLTPQAAAGGGGGASPAATASGTNTTNFGAPSAANGTDSGSTGSGPLSAGCATVPRRAGYTPIATAPELYQGQRAFLVVYSASNEPAAGTVYAVLYAGSCPNASSLPLDQGWVAISR